MKKINFSIFKRLKRIHFVGSVLFLFLANISSATDRLKVEYEDDAQSLLELQILPPLQIPKSQLYLLGEVHNRALIQDLQIKILERIHSSDPNLNCLFLEMSHELRQKIFNDFIDGKISEEDVHLKFGSAATKYSLPYLIWAKNNNIKVIANDNYNEANYTISPSSNEKFFDNRELMYARNNFFTYNILQHFDKKICKHSAFIVGLAHLTEKGQVLNSNVRYSPMGKTIKQERPHLSSYTIITPGNAFNQPVPQRSTQPDLSKHEYTLEYVDLILQQ